MLIVEICLCGRGTINTSSHPGSDVYLRDTDRSYVFLALGRLGPKSKLCERWVVKSWGSCFPASGNAEWNPVVNVQSMHIGTHRACIYQGMRGGTMHILLFFGTCYMPFPFSLPAYLVWYSLHRQDSPHKTAFCNMLSRPCSGHCWLFGSDRGFRSLLCAPSTPSTPQSVTSTSSSAAWGSGPGLCTSTTLLLARPAAAAAAARNIEG